MILDELITGQETYERGFSTISIDDAKEVAKQYALLYLDKVKANLAVESMYCGEEPETVILEHEFTASEAAGEVNYSVIPVTNIEELKKEINEST